MTLLSLLYVSRSTTEAAKVEAVVADIVETAHWINPQMDLTGALIFTGSSFAQILEGPAGAVDALMTSISADPRHKDLLIVDRSRVPNRRFDQWSMAYSGRVRFVERHVTALLDAPSNFTNAYAAKQLRNLIHEFAQ